MVSTSEAPRVRAFRPAFALVPPHVDVDDEEMHDDDMPHVQDDPLSDSKPSSSILKERRFKLSR